MGRFRTNITGIVVGLVAAALLLEFTGYRAEIGASWSDTLGIIPVEIAGPFLVVVGLLWLLDP